MTYFSFYFFLLACIGCELYVWRFEVQNTYTEKFNQTTLMVGLGDCSAAGYQKERLSSIRPKSFSKPPVSMLALSTIKLGTIVDNGQRPMEAFGDMIHIQEGILQFMQNGGSFIS